ncbi:MEDS domain-containing protein [Actinomadura madurae]|uniref:MEDS domain-containing protein n=1 Tax=Actinomadura madurae TaxID=1993 RepID=UPI0020D2395A|nr:MEDS domain-containing protein [Actinomadura madurae]MCP9953666.1 MEDS domain-containing protein [Actinomadura madurae]MCP9970422.1 MEDS domain-containing protein [Actinomadura madurae]MCP9982904.1 MEDS domain-containing protein [Actinomadura madurae]MCQ0005548.1 MEDS domain-containing protein [Actinomadura madurae]
MSAVGTGTKPVGAMELGDHLALIFDDDEERRSIMAAYARDGVAAGHKVIYISDGVRAGDVLGWLLAEHESTGPAPHAAAPRAAAPHAAPEGAPVDLAEAMEEGHFVVRTAEETFLASGRFDPSESLQLMATEIDLALVQGYSGVRIAGEARFSLRRWPGTHQHGDFERMLDEVFMTTDLKAMAICQFDRRWFEGARLADVEAAHMGRVRANDYYDDGALRISPLFSPPGARVAGVIDAATRPAAASVLESIKTRTGLLCLDLEGLEACDPDGLRMLTGADRPARDRGLLLRGVPAEVHAGLRAEGLDEAPGVSIERAVR